MIIKLFFLLLIFSVQAAIACDVTLPHQMIILGDDVNGKKNYQAQNCDEKTLDELHQIVTGLEGRIASFQLMEFMKAKGHEIQIFPQSVLIQQFSTLIRDQLILPTGVQVKKTYSVDMLGILVLPAGDKVQVSCSSCLFGNLQPLNVTILGFDGTSRSMIVKADFKKMVKAFKLITPVASFSSLTDGNLFVEEYIESIPHTDLVTDRETLRFYKTNKPLRTGDILKFSDLNAINLVKAGLKTDVVLENQMIRIKTHGISRGNGTIGELVEVFHPQKNKKYLGKVVDLNKVQVDL